MLHSTLLLNKKCQNSIWKLADEFQDPQSKSHFHYGHSGTFRLWFMVFHSTIHSTMCVYIWLSNRSCGAYISKLSAFYFSHHFVFQSPFQITWLWLKIPDSVSPEHPLALSLILILSFMYFAVIMVESLRGVQHQRRYRDRDEPAASPDKATGDPAQFPVTPALSLNLQRMAAENH